MAKCAAVKTLFLGYLGSVAAAAHMAAAPRAFAELKKAMEAVSYTHLTLPTILRV